MIFILKAFTFTNAIRNLTRKISFRIQVLWKSLKLFFNKNQKLKKKILVFSDKNVFDKSVFTLTYDFENAIYYELKGIHKSLIGQSIYIYDNQQAQPLEFIVHGFRKKEVYFLNYEVTEKIASEKFDIQFIKHFKIEKLNLKRKIKSRRLSHYQFKIKLKIISPKIENIRLKYHSTLFNEKEFI